MITPNEIETAIGQHLRDGLPGRTIVWPNTDADPERPFIAFLNNITSRTDNTWAGGNVVTRGSIKINIVTKRNQFTTEANNIAAEIFNLFPYPLSIITENGLIIINEPPDIEDVAYVDGADWRLPVRISYQTKE